MRHRRAALTLALTLSLATLFAPAALPTATAAPTADKLPKVGHVWLVMLENKSYAESFAPGSRAPALTKLAKQGALLEQYFGIAHTSLPNYIALVSGQGPNPDTQANCHDYSEFVGGAPKADGQLPGTGCVFPASVHNLGTQLSAADISWKAYLQNLGASTTRQVAPCGVPVLDRDGQDLSRTATPGDQYAARHNPFVYFHSITDHPKTCEKHLAPLTPLTKDVQQVDTTPAFNLVVPDLCNSGHDTPCVGKDAAGDGTGGLSAVQHWMDKWIPAITGSPAFQKDGLLLVTWDEASVAVGPDGKPDADACCDERALNTRTPGGSPNHASLTGPGGGRVGLIAVSPFIRPGTVSNRPYNHYSTLRTLEDLYGVPRLGYAGQATGVQAFGSDVFTRPKGGSVTVPAASPTASAEAVDKPAASPASAPWAALAIGAGVLLLLLLGLALRARRRS